jgi:hypothetical protein
MVSGSVALVERVGLGHLVPLAGELLDAAYHALTLVAEGDDLHGAIGQDGVGQRAGEGRDPAEDFLANGGVTRYDGDAERSELQFVEISDLGDRHGDPRFDALFEGTDDLALVFQGLGARNFENQPHHADVHGTPRVATGSPS